MTNVERNLQSYDAGRETETSVCIIQELQQKQKLVYNFNCHTVILCG